MSLDLKWVIFEVEQQSTIVVLLVGDMHNISLCDISKRKLVDKRYDYRKYVSRYDDDDGGGYKVIENWEFNVNEIDGVKKKIE